MHLHHYYDMSVIVHQHIITHHQHCLNQQSLLHLPAQTLRLMIASNLSRLLINCCDHLLAAVLWSNDERTAPFPFQASNISIHQTSANLSFLSPPPFGWLQSMMSLWHINRSDRRAAIRKRVINLLSRYRPTARWEIPTRESVAVSSDVCTECRGVPSGGQCKRTR